MQTLRRMQINAVIIPSALDVAAKRHGQKLRVSEMSRLELQKVQRPCVCVIKKRSSGPRKAFLEDVCGSVWQADPSVGPCSVTPDRNRSWKTHTVKGSRGTFFTTLTKSTSSSAVTQVFSEWPPLAEAFPLAPVAHAAQRRWRPFLQPMSRRMLTENQRTVWTVRASSARGLSCSYTELSS